MNLRIKIGIARVLSLAFVSFVLMLIDFYYVTPLVGSPMIVSCAGSVFLAPLLGIHLSFSECGIYFLPFILMAAFFLSIDSQLDHLEDKLTAPLSGD